MRKIWIKILVVSLMTFGMVIPTATTPSANAGISTLSNCVLDYQRDVPTQLNASTKAFTFEMKYALRYDSNFRLTTTTNLYGGVQTTDHTTLIGSTDIQYGLHVFYNTVWLGNNREVQFIIGQANGRYSYFRNANWKFPNFTESQGISPFVHIAVVRDNAGYLTVFFDGVGPSQTYQNPAGQAGGTWVSGSRQLDTNTYTSFRYMGYDSQFTVELNPKNYISNLRYVKGASLYDTSLTSLTIPTTAQLRLNGASGTTELLLNSLSPAGIVTNSANGNSTPVAFMTTGGVTASGPCPANAAENYVGGEGVYNVFFAEGNTASTSGTLPSQQFYDSTESPLVPITVPSNGTLAKTGNYSFGGWNTAPDGSGTTYAPGSPFTPSSNATLYTKWIAAYSVTYSKGTANGSEAAPTQTAVASGGTFLVAANPFSKTASIFTGWSDGTSTYQPGDTYTMGSANKTLTAQWTTGYKATYNANSATSGTVPATQQYASPSGTALTISSNTGNLQRTGYAFAGWNTASSGSLVDYAEGQTSVTLSADIILHAKWTANTNVVTYDAQGGTSVTSGLVTTGSTLTLPIAPSRAGYAFRGWFIAATGGTALVSGYTPTNTAAFTLYAQWNANTNTVTYNPQGGAAVTSGSVATGSTLTLPSAPSHPGYTFNGWFEAATGGTALASGYTPTLTAAFTLYAQWTAVTYTISYDANSATSGSVPASQSYTNGGTALTLNDNSATPLLRTGYTFAGWNTAANGTGTNYSGGATSQIFTANTSLYAKWTANSYSVTFDSQLGSAQSAVAFTTGNTVTMPAASTRAGYTFAGWNTASDGTGTNYNASQSGISFAISTALYAKWTANSFNASFNSQGGSAVSPISFTTGSTLTLPADPSRTGYTFNGWFAATSGGSDLVSGYSPANTSAFTLYAQWTGVGYQLTFDANSATTGIAPTSQSYTTGGSTITLPGNSGILARTGYTFAGWATAANGSGTSYTATQTGITLNTDLLLYAKWTGITYTISYNANSSTSGSIPSSQSYTSGGTALTLATNSGTLAKSGFFFAGWNTAADGLGTDYTDGSTGQTFGTNTTLYAKWTTTPTSTVTFKANSGVGSDTSQSTNVDTNLISNTFTRPGYIFAGWNTAADGSGTNYANGVSYPFASNLILFAKWTAKTARTLSFNTTTFNKSYGETQTVTAALSLGTGAITYSRGISTACTINPTTGLVTITNGVGTCEISASAVEDTTYQAVSTTTSVSMTVSKSLPGLPTLGLVTSVNGVLTVAFTQSDFVGNGITDYKYSIDGINFISVGNTTSPLSIPGLTPGTYTLQILAVNSLGDGTPTAAVTVIVIAGPTVTVTTSGGGGGGGFVPSGPSASEIAAGTKAAVDKALADKAAADKVIADKAAAEKLVADKLAADKAAADKAVADKLAADKAAADKAIADKLAADSSAAAAQFKSTCNLALGSTAVFSKSSTMKIYSQVCFIPDLMKPLDKDLAQFKSVVSQIKSKKITSITLSSFADEKSGVNFKSVAQTRADVVAAMIKKGNPKIKITYRLFGSSTKKNSLSLGRVVISA